jgi:glutamyl-tRNA synthetase
MDRPVRVRFAPSPTGSLHIGSARTALFNWLFARHHGGVFILRIEDTDQKRFVPGSPELIQEDLSWLGLNWDEGPGVGGGYGPYVESERTALYREWANWLLEHDRAYRCYCTPKQLAARRQEGGQGYDRHCRHLTPAQRADYEARGDAFVIRFKMPLEGETTVHDLIRGDITFKNETLTDLVLLKSDGFPTYHLANVVDDRFMEISHILRADEWISSAPVHYQLYEAFGWAMPAIAHLPVILNPNGHGKLSKRTARFMQDGRRVPILVHEFREAGYLPAAVINFLTNIGWSFGEDREVFSVEETIPRFDLSRINPAGGKFPLEKLDWLNGIYIRSLEPSALAAPLREALEASGYPVNVDVLRRVIPLVQTRLQSLHDVVEMAGFFFKDSVSPAAADLLQKDMDAETTRATLAVAYDALAALPEFEAATLEQALRALTEKLGLRTDQLFGALRAAITGQRVSPPLFETMAIVGREACLKRIKAAEALL